MWRLRKGTVGTIVWRMPHGFPTSPIASVHSLNLNHRLWSCPEFQSSWRGATAETCSTGSVGPIDSMGPRGGSAGPGLWGAPGDGSALAASNGGFLVAPPGGLPAAVIPFGDLQIWGTWDAPAELLVVAGPGRKVYAMNLGRFLAVDVLTSALGISITGQLNLGLPPDRGVDPAIVPNVFEQMVAVLALPRAAIDSARQAGCAMNLQLDRDVGGQNSGGCPMTVILGTETSSATVLMHEWLHGDVAQRKVTGWALFARTISVRF